MRVRFAFATAAIAVAPSRTTLGAQAAPPTPGSGVDAIVGVVRGADESALFGAHVTVLAPATRAPRVDALTGADGAFRVDAIPAGSAVLVVQRLGFRPETLSVDVPQPPGGPVVVMLAPVAQPLAPVVVRERLRAPALGTDFERRRGGGFGHFVTRADVERERPERTSDLFRTIPGVTLASNTTGSLVPHFRAAGRADRCEPAYWLNGVPLGNGTPDLDAIDPASVDGIEVYSGNATVPPALHQTTMAGGCGVIALWTRRGRRADEGDGASPVLADSLGAMVARGWAYTADQVELPALPLPGLGPRPAYPDSLLAAGVRGRVVAEFVVDAQGRVDPETVGIVSSTHRLFTAAVRAALSGARFSPAYRQRRVVRQVVHLPVVFEPGTGMPSGAASPSPERD